MNAIPCERCGEPPSSHLHRPSSACVGCKAPQDHHTYRPDMNSLQMLAVDLTDTLAAYIRAANRGLRVGAFSDQNVKATELVERARAIGVFRRSTGDTR